MSRMYTRNEILTMCEKAFVNPETFYQKDMINYRGVTGDTGEYYTEIIANYICRNFDDFRDAINTITRKSTYKVLSHIGNYSEQSNRIEEITAIKMWKQSQNGYMYNYIGKIIDYQVPLKNKRSDVAGKIDLLSYDGQVLRILELKKADSEETLLRCILEGFTYLKTVNVDKLLDDFSLPRDTKVKCCPFVFLNSVQYKEAKEKRTWLNRLIDKTGSEIYYIVEDHEEYRVVMGE